MSFPSSEEFKRNFEKRIEAAGWSGSLQSLIGRANLIEGHISYAAYCHKIAGVPDDQNPALKSAQALITNILTNEQANFMRALKVESLNTKELLSEGIERKQIWTEMKCLLKEMTTVQENNASMLTKLVRFTDDRQNDEGVYGITAALTRMIVNFPKERDIIPNEAAGHRLQKADVHRLQEAFEKVLQNQNLPLDLRPLVAMKVIYTVYLYGSHVPGFLIFESHFMNQILEIVKRHRSQSNEDQVCQRSLERILLSIHKRVTN